MSESGLRVKGRNTHNRVNQEAWCCLLPTPRFCFNLCIFPEFKSLWPCCPEGCRDVTTVGREALGSPIPSSSSAPVSPVSPFSAASPSLSAGSESTSSSKSLSSNGTVKQKHSEEEKEAGEQRARLCGRWWRFSRRRSVKTVGGLIASEGPGLGLHRGQSELGSPPQAVRVLGRPAFLNSSRAKVKGRSS